MLKRNQINARKKKGQSTIEYIILVAAVLAAVLAFNGAFTNAVSNTLESGTNGMTDMAQNIGF